MYKKRTAVESVNSRLDVSFGFEQHYIRGVKEDGALLSACDVYNACDGMGRIKEKQKDYMRSLVRAV